MLIYYSFSIFSIFILIYSIPLLSNVVKSREPMISAANRHQPGGRTHEDRVNVGTERKRSGWWGSEVSTEELWRPERRQQSPLSNLFTSHYVSPYVAPHYSGQKKERETRALILPSLIFHILLVQSL